MCFAAPDKLVSALVTTHLPLAKVSKALSAEGVAYAATELAGLLRRLGHERPTVLVCSLNPHAGESELLGREEERTIVPGIALAQRALGKRAKVLGPVGAETAFRKAFGASGVGVLAMYHDQATIPMKLVAFGEGVNVTQGLSIVRTSVDHGTGYDIAGTGKADPLGMISAMQLAEALVRTP
jgi:4-hydroxythreonine-4-phosphate dehydrogenase